MVNNLLTEEDYAKIVKEKLKTDDAEFIEAEITPISENVEGFMGEHYNLKIRYKISNEEKVETFFIKAKPTKSEFQREIASRIYVKEVFLYDKLLKEFEKMGYYTGFAPKGYYCKGDDVLVMQNLVHDHFKLFDRNQFYDIDHCKVALKALAYYHANSLAYEELKTDELGRKFRFNEENPEAFEGTLFSQENDKGNFFISSGIHCFIHMSKLLPESNQWKDSFENKMKAVDCPKLFNKPLPYRTTCTHGDLWSNNMLFKYEKDVPVQCSLVDFQLIRHHHPGYDVVLVLYTNTTKEFRKKHMQELLEYYYQTFASILKEHELEADVLLPKEHFLESANYFKIIALIQAACTRMFVMLPPKVTNSSVESGKDLEMLFFKKEKDDIVAAAFQDNDKFRIAMTDNIYDLDEHL